MLFTLSNPSSLGRLDHATMSQQALMECLVAQIDERSLRKFRDKDKNFKDVDEWPGVELDNEGDVVGIFWDTGNMTLQGTLSLQWLPVTVKHLKIHPLFHYSNYQARKSVGAIEVRGILRDLPPSMETLNIGDCTVSMPLCLLEIPKGLSKINISCHAFGNIDLRCSSSSLKSLSITQGTQQGTLSFIESSPSLATLDLSSNRLIGPLSFRGLAPRLRSLFLNENDFHGIIILEDLPLSLRDFCLRNANFEKMILNTALSKKLKYFHASNSSTSGKVDFLHYPEATEEILINDNRLSGSVRIGHLANMRILQAEGNLLEGSMDFRKLPNQLRKLDLSSNKLTGTIDFGVLPKLLGNLNLGNNSLTGSFVIDSALPILNLANNQLEMETLVVLIDARNLPEIDLRGNGVRNVVNEKGKSLKAMNIVR